MKGKLIWSIFWALVGVFVIVISMIAIPRPLWPLGFPPAIFLSAIVVFVLLGVALLFLTVKTKVAGILKKFLLLTGASAVGLPVFVLLHNAIYGLFIHFFGADFWDRTGIGDEPFFFFMAVFICPIAFLVGVAGSVVLTIKSKQVKHSI
ncbi:hypothetical protein ACFLWC_01290 [Chloroflexota bacterium]